MHFWIDKRSEACRFSGRHRVPSSLSGFGRPRVLSGRTHVKLMVTPVHRFQSIESVATNGRHPRPPGYQPRHPSTAYRQPSLNYIAVNRPNNNNVVRITETSHTIEPAIQQVTETQNNTATRLRPLSRSDKRKCGIWTSFAVAMVFTAGAKFYFNDRTSTFVEAFAFSSLLLIVLLVGCAVSLFDAIKSTTGEAGMLTPEHTTPPHSTQETSQQSAQQNEEFQMLQLHVTPAQVPAEVPPPPYHIAIMLPPQVDAETLIIDDSPPPSYDKAVT